MPNYCFKQVECKQWSQNKTYHRLTLPQTEYATRECIFEQNKKNISIDLFSKVISHLNQCEVFYDECWDSADNFPSNQCDVIYTECWDSHGYKACFLLKLYLTLPSILITLFLN